MTKEMNVVLNRISTRGWKFPRGLGAGCTD